MKEFILKHKIILKAITYRIFAVTTAVAITLCFGLSVCASITLTITINAIHTVLFYYHEKTWKRIKRHLRK